MSCQDGARNTGAKPAAPVIPANLKCPRSDSNPSPFVGHRSDKKTSPKRGLFPGAPEATRIPTPLWGAEPISKKDLSKKRSLLVPPRRLERLTYCSASWILVFYGLSGLD